MVKAMRNLLGTISFFLPVMLFSFLQATCAEESIIAFWSDVAVQSDSTLNVTETIQVRAENKKIRHGIYRDFPTRYHDIYGRKYSVKFTLLGVTNNGLSTGYFTEVKNNGVRIKIGSRDTSLTPGVYTYTISYKVTRELGFFEDHDELYWNVTGNGWDFPIKSAQARVALPHGVPLDAVKLYGYTGAHGSKEQHYSTVRSLDGKFNFTTTRPLWATEGLTIVVSWPKGFVHEPTQKEQLNYFLSDNADLIIGMVGLLLVFMYYFTCWSLVGRDPPSGTIVPLFQPPGALSPADVRYLTNMKYEDATLAASVINMAVKGYLTIEEKFGEYTLRRISSDDTKLSSEEKDIAAKIFSGGASIELRTSNYRTFLDARKGAKEILENKHNDVHFLRNGRYTIRGVFLSLVILGAVVALQPNEILTSSAPLIIALMLWSVLAYGLSAVTFSMWGSTIRVISAGALLGAIGVSLFALPFIAAECFLIYTLWQQGAGAIAVVGAVAIILNLVFLYLLKAPTVEGRKLLDGIEGFKMFLSATESDKLLRVESPTKTPELFEKFLPYAVALGVEQKWANSFSHLLGSVMQGASSQHHGYSPAWYHGQSFTNIGGFSSGFATSFGTALSSSSTPPGSSSGDSGGSSGGGSSGGGGGGGGGGGW
jgi:hypothetical protein